MGGEEDRPHYSSAHLSPCSHNQQQNAGARRHRRTAGGLFDWHAHGGEESTQVMCVINIIQKQNTVATAACSRSLRRLSETP